LRSYVENLQRQRLAVPPELGRSIGEETSGIELAHLSREWRESHVLS
jgi:hypothetical protein